MITLQPCHNAPGIESRPAALPAPILDAWWRGFNDAELSKIVDRALAQNLDLAASFARVEQARAAAKAAGANLSRAVKEFENERGYLFFERNGKRVAAITDSGQAFIRAIQPVLDDLRAGFERACEMGLLISRQKAGSFLIGYSPLVPSAISEQMRSIRSIRFPALRLQFRTLAPTELFDSLASGALQAAVTYGFSGRRDLEQIQIGSQRLHAVYPRNQDGRQTATVALQDLRSHSLIVPSSERMQPEIRDWLLEQCERAGFRPKIVEEPTSTREAFDLVKDRAGLGVMPGGICDGMTEKLDSSPIVGIGELQLVLTYKRECGPRIQRIATEIANALRQACLKTGS